MTDDNDDGKTTMGIVLMTMLLLLHFKVHVP